MTDKLILWGVIAALVAVLSTGLYYAVRAIGETKAELQQAEQAIESQRAQMAVNRIQAEQDRSADAAALAEYRKSQSEQTARAKKLEQDLKDEKRKNADFSRCLDMPFPDAIRLPGADHNNGS